MPTRPMTSRKKMVEPIDSKNKMSESIGDELEIESVDSLESSEFKEKQRSKSQTGLDSKASRRKSNESQSFNS